MVTASGMAAVTTAVLALVSAGDHVIGQKSTYGGTAVGADEPAAPVRGRGQPGRPDRLEAFARAITPKTKLMLLETPSNPLLQVTDLTAVVEMAKAHEIVTLADNTFATPINQRPAEFGVDLVWHSATKYLNGHTDVSAGAMAGPAELLDRIWDTALLTGATLGPIDAWLLVPRHADPAAAGAATQRERAGGRRGARQAPRRRSKVHYPGLESHPQHELAVGQMSGFGGVLGIEMGGGFDAADAFLARLRYPRRSASLGGVESPGGAPGGNVARHAQRDPAGGIGRPARPGPDRRRHRGPRRPRRRCPPGPGAAPPQRDRCGVRLLSYAPRAPAQSDTADIAWRVGLLVGDVVVGADDAAQRLAHTDARPSVESARQILGWPRHTRAELQQAAEDLAQSGQVVGALSSVSPGPPVPDPDKIVCVALNYRAHADEAGFAPPAAPALFAKFRTSLVGAGRPVTLPAVSNQIDYEGELAVVIGRQARNVTADDALAYVGGYLPFNDLTARDLQFQTSQWTAGKALDDFAPCGPALVTADEVPDPQRLMLTTHVNGQLRQHASTADMLFGVADLVAFVSSLMTLEPGDIIATGTPEGVGLARTPPAYLQPGDTVTVTINDPAPGGAGQLGVLTTPLRSPTDLS